MVGGSMAKTSFWRGLYLLWTYPLSQWEYLPRIGEFSYGRSLPDALRKAMGK